MTTTDMSPWRSRPTRLLNSHELTSLDERLGLLLIVRIGIVVFWWSSVRSSRRARSASMSSRSGL